MTEGNGFVPVEEARFHVAPDGEPWIEARRGAVWQALGSRHAPGREAERIVAETPEGEINVVFVFGAGQPSLIRRALRTFPEIPVAVFDADPEVAKASREAVASSSPHLHWFGPDDAERGMERILLEHPARSVRFLHCRAQMAAQAAFIAKLKAEAANLHDRKNINVNTLGKFEKLWLRNLVHNTRLILGAGAVSAVDGKGAGLTAILVAAGPTLAADLPKIRALKDRVVVVAVDTAVKTLLRHGIEPHVVIVVDPQKVNSRYVEDLPASFRSRALLVAEPSVTPAALAPFEGRTLLFDTVFPWYRLLATLQGPRGSLDLGGSVATAGFDFCRRAAFDRVLICGLDLSFSEDAYHVPGTFYEEFWYASVNRLRSFEMLSWRLIDYGQCVGEPDIHGRTVWLDAKFRMFRRWFEDRLVKPEVARIFRGTSAGGATIRGLDRMDIDSFASETSPDAPARLRDFRDALEAAVSAAPRSPDLLARLKDAIATMRSELPAWVDAAEQATLVSERLEKRLAMGQGAEAGLLRKLDECDRILASEVAGKPLVNAALQKLIHAVESGAVLDEEDAGLPTERRHVRNSLRLYRETAEAGRLALRLLAWAGSQEFRIETAR